MEKIGPYEFDPLTEEDAASEQLRGVMRRYEENSRLWKVSLLFFLGSVLAYYLLDGPLGKNVEGGFSHTKPGEFLILAGVLFFLLFLFSVFRERSLLKKKWACPKCGQKLPYFVSKSGGGGRFYNKELLDECWSRGFFLGKKKDCPFIMPGKCPVCGEKLNRE